ncbi:methyltransferase domain-containing protein, partial [bacterium]
REPGQDDRTGCWSASATDPDGNGFGISSFVEALQEKLLGELYRLGNVEAKSDVDRALRAVPRHIFLPNHTLEEVYENRAIMTKKEGEATSSCSQPSVVAVMLNQASLRAGDNVLEIGAGTGWNSALMGHIIGPQGFVTTIDIDADTAEFARSNLTQAGATNVEVICGDGGLGFESRAPYDVIIVTAEMPDLSPHLLRQLRVVGRIHDA